MKNKYISYSDTHFNFAFPWTLYNFIEKIAEQKPKGLFLSGDIACGLTIRHTLEYFARKLDLPIYFILGNHDSYGSSFEKTAEVIEQLKGKYSNLFWLQREEVIGLTENVGLIGEDGWYDARLGNPNYVVYNFDWIMISEFGKLPRDFDIKLKYTRDLADKSTASLKIKLEKALEKYQTVYVMTHVPPYPEATTEFKDFWLPYNTNSHMGKMIEEVMADRGNQNVVIIAGHIHQFALIHVSHNIECIVQAGKYLGAPQEQNFIFI